MEKVARADRASDGEGGRPGSFAAAEMKPAWSAILLGVLSGTGQGVLLAAFLLDASRRPPEGFLLACCGLSFAFLAGGLAAWFFARARAAAQSPTSWLSREAIVRPALMGLVALYGLSVQLGAGKPVSLGIGAAAALLAVALYVCTAMIHARLASVPAWHAPLTLVNFVLLGTASGAALAVPAAVLAWPQFTGPLALAAFALAALAWLVRIASMVRNARLRSGSPAAGAVGAGAARWAFLVLAFPVPAWLLGWGGGSLAAYVAAFVLQFAGLLAERRLFFAEAGSPRNPYEAAG